MITKETLIEQLVTIVHVIGTHLSDQLKEIIQVACVFFERHLNICLDLVESLCLIVQDYDVDRVLSKIIPSILKTVKEEPSAAAEDISTGI